MTQPRDHLDELLAGAALGALDAEEAERLRTAGRAGDLAARAEALELTAAACVLADLRLETPPPALLASLHASADRLATEPRDGDATGPLGAERRVAPGRARPRLGPIAAAVAVLVVAGGGATLAWRVLDERGAVAEQRRVAAMLSTQVAERAVFMRDADDLVQMTLRPAGGPAWGDVVWSDRAHRGFVRLRDARRNDPATARYQLFAMDARGAAVPVGLFDVALEGCEYVVPLESPMLDDPRRFVLIDAPPAGLAAYDPARDAGRVIAGTP